MRVELIYLMSPPNPNNEHLREDSMPDRVYTANDEIANTESTKVSET